VAGKAEQGTARAGQGTGIEQGKWEQELSSSPVFVLSSGKDSDEAPVSGAWLMRLAVLQQMLPAPSYATVVWLRQMVPVAPKHVAVGLHHQD
jgi:hypothetical protein